MSKRILLLALGAVFLFGNSRVFADSITLGPFDQETLDWVRLTSIPAPGSGGIPKTNTLTITVRNTTKATWDDYRFLFITPPGGAQPNNVVTISMVVPGNNPFTQDKILFNNQNSGNGGKKASVEFFGGNLAPGASFTVSLNLTYNSSVNIWGQPSVGGVYTPEPSSLLLLGTGILGLVPVVRRKLLPGVSTEVGKPRSVLTL
jgi:hypothetical protein